MIKAELPIVSNAIVIGDQRIYLVCLITLKVCGGEGGGDGGGVCITVCAHLQVEMDDQGLPTNLLTQEARRECQKVGSNSETVDAIIDGSGDAAVLKMIKKGIDRVNARASTKAQKVCRLYLSVCLSVCLCLSVCVKVLCYVHRCSDGRCWRETLALLEES